MEGTGSQNLDSKRLYVGNLAVDVCKSELEDLFGKFGRVVGVDLFVRNSNPYAFVDFESEIHAEEAVKNLDGRRWGDMILRVEQSRKIQQRQRSPIPRGYRVHVKNLPLSTSCKDLEKHLKRAGTILKANINNDGTGFIDFLRRKDMEYAIEHYNNSKITTSEKDCGYIRMNSERMRHCSNPRTTLRRHERNESRYRTRSISQSPLESSQQRSRSDTGPPAKKLKLRSSSDQNQEELLQPATDIQTVSV
ncbi:SRSF1 [Cordylochernes scorpioides]|uniref:SRSF1 n=1 Tax=Cordylochernes scorpioides TaxID=51811 RepID=A0ABY6KPT4_9ARAC|nr:SRSF1 [Cordylochernes scorpioides]